MLRTLILAAVLSILACTLHAQEVQTDTLAGRARSTNPHGLLPFPCESCHTTASWNVVRSPMQFDHDRETSFPLEGQHKAGDCTACHSDLRFKMSRTECNQCHKDVHRGQLGQQCGTCHTSAGWKPRDPIARHAATRFPLTGKHTTTDCRSCHASQQEGEFAGVSTECVTCHVNIYQRTSNPPHVSAGLGTDCMSCHTTGSWTPAIANHGLFGFTLDGAHKSVTCTDCHIGNNYALASSTCVACHQAAYDQSSNPPHASGGFPVTCEQCHTTRPGWRPARFDHNATSFALTGAHKSIENQCNKCHESGFQNTPTDCYDCHSKDYTAAVDPPHVNAFPTTCTDCHGTSSWVPSTFDHQSSFPIYSGSHKGKWTGCMTSGDGSGCHNLPSDFKEFSCIHCHDHSQSRMDHKHDEREDYVYESHACFECHPTGKGD